MIKCVIGNNINRKSITIDENTTLREALEGQEINYARYIISLNGSTLSPGDLDKTFADHGVTERCHLLTVAKADNAASVKLVGGACVIESAYTTEQLKTLEKYRSEALALYEGEGNNRDEVFRIGVAKKGGGSINSVGASFGAAVSGDGKATITLMIPEGTEDKKAWAEEAIGSAILKLNKVESQLGDAIADVAAEQAAVRECIQVV